MGDISSDNFVNDASFWDGVLDVCAGIEVDYARRRGEEVDPDLADRLLAKAEESDWIFDIIYSEWFLADAHAQVVLIEGLVARFIVRLDEFQELKDGMLGGIAAVHVAHCIIAHAARSVVIRWFIDKAKTDTTYERLWTHYLNSGE